MSLVDEKRDCRCRLRFRVAGRSITISSEELDSVGSLALVHSVNSVHGVGEHLYFLDTITFGREDELFDLMTRNIEISGERFAYSIYLLSI